MKPSKKIMSLSFAALSLLSYGVTSAHAQTLIDPTAAFSIANYNGGTYGGTVEGGVAGNVVDGSGLDTTYNGVTFVGGTSGGSTTSGPYTTVNLLPTGTPNATADITTYSSTPGFAPWFDMDWIAGGTATTSQQTGINIAFNLGSGATSQTISGFHYWNGNHPGQLALDVQTAEVLVSNDATFATGVVDLGKVTLSQATGLDSYTGADATTTSLGALSFTGYQYVMLDNITSYTYGGSLFGGQAQASLSEIRFDTSLPATPEPTSIALIGLGALALLISRRRTA